MKLLEEVQQHVVKREVRLAIRVPVVSKYDRYRGAREEKFAF